MRAALINTYKQYNGRVISLILAIYAFYYLLFNFIYIQIILKAYKDVALYVQNGSKTPSASDLGFSALWLQIRYIILFVIFLIIGTGFTYLKKRRFVREFIISCGIVFLGYLVRQFLISFFS